MKKLFWLLIAIMITVVVGCGSSSGGEIVFLLNDNNEVTATYIDTDGTVLRSEQMLVVDGQDGTFYLPCDRIIIVPYTGKSIDETMKVYGLKRAVE